MSPETKIAELERQIALLRQDIVTLRWEKDQLRQEFVQFKCRMSALINEKAPA